MNKVEGGRNAAKTNKERYGEDYYRRIGAMGGRKSKGGGFSRVEGLARSAGRLGGMNSKVGGRELIDCSHRDHPQERFEIDGVDYIRCTHCQMVRLAR